MHGAGQVGEGATVGPGCARDMLEIGVVREDPGEAGVGRPALLQREQRHRPAGLVREGLGERAVEPVARNER